MAHFARTTAWADPRDLVQEAAVAALVAATKWSPARGPLDCFQACVARNELIDYTRRASRMVAGAEVAFGYAPLDLELAGDVPTPEADIDRQRTIERMRAILAEHSAAARAVLLEERDAGEVAVELVVPVARVYLDTRTAKEAVRRRLVEMGR